MFYIAYVEILFISCAALVLVDCCINLFLCAVVPMFYAANVLYCVDNECVLYVLHG